jgi:hypothetical protein
MMRRLIIQADADLLDRARRRAAERGVSMAQVVREALEVALGDKRQPDILSIGKFRSDTGDLSERASNDEYVPPPWRSS